MPTSQPKSAQPAWLGNVVRAATLAVNSAGPHMEFVGEVRDILEF